MSDVAHECAVGYHAARFVDGMRPGAFRQWGSARSGIEADGGRAAWRAETMRIVRDFSAADGIRRDAHLDIRREAHRQTRPRRRSKLQVAAHARTDACRLDGRPCAELAGRGSGGHRSHRAMKGLNSMCLWVLVRALSAAMENFYRLNKIATIGNAAHY